MNLHPGYAAFAYGDNTRGDAPGLTRREYFAAAALQGLLASGPHDDCGVKEIVQSALLYADAMIAALNGGEKE